MEKCHLKISVNPRFENKKRDIGYSIKFCEDNSIAKPQFIKNSSVEHTIQARWITPCRIASKSSGKPLVDERCYNAYYHPLAYQLAKNQEFKRIIIENAIENFRAKKNLDLECDYDIVSSIDNDICKTTPFSQPKHEISVFNNNISQQKFIQLIIWLPLIISGNSIIIETSSSNFYLQTEKPHKYELNLTWPDSVQDLEICFCNFIKKDKCIVIVGQYNAGESCETDDMCDKDNQRPQIEPNQLKLSSKLNEIISNQIANIETNEDELERTVYHCNSNDHQTLAVIESISNDIIQKPNQPGKSKKGRRVRFNSVNCCLYFEEVKPVSDISVLPDQNVPMKTNDGSTAKKFNFHLNKSQKANRDNKGHKSARSKRNNNKKKK